MYECIDFSFHKCALHKHILTSACPAPTNTVTYAWFVLSFSFAFYLFSLPTRRCSYSGQTENSIVFCTKFLITLSLFVLVNEWKCETSRNTIRRTNVWVGLARICTLYTVQKSLVFHVIICNEKRNAACVSTTELTVNYMMCFVIQHVFAVVLLAWILSISSQTVASYQAVLFTCSLGFLCFLCFFLRQ